MKQLINYCPVHGYEQEVNAYADGMKGYLKNNKLDGIELYVYQQKPYTSDYREESIGVHLKYWPYWLDFWYGNQKYLNENYSDKKQLQEYYLGAVNQEEWLQIIRNNIKAALAVNPEYLVCHVSNCNLKEIFTFDFFYNDAQVIDASIEVFNAVSECIPDNVIVLFENLWWPGLRLTEPAVVRAFFEKIKHKNVGIMLDTGHLMNTNPELQTEEDGIEYILKTVKALGEDRKLIRGLHLNCSLSGDYVKTFERVFDSESSNIERMKHVIKIDQHRPFTDKAVQKLLRFIKPDYVVHELAYRDFSDFEKNIEVQLTACGRKLSIDDEGD